MAILVSAHEVSHAYGAKKLYSGLTFSLESGERTGLIGPNGAGKSTLLKMLAREVTPDSGTLSFARGLKVGFLRQVPTFKPGATVLDTLLEGATGDGAGGGIHADPHQSAYEWLSKLELDVFGPDAPVERLSGGWKKRVALGRELVRNPDLLLLDEPTNHLDIEGIEWLEKFLARAPFACLTITHDRAFLQKVSNRILELDPRHAGGILAVQGDYATYLGVREALIDAQEKREVILRNTMRREVEWLRQGAKARTTKQQARIQRANALIEEVGELGSRNQVKVSKLEFESTGRSPKKLVEAKGIAKKFSDRFLFRNLSLVISPGTRLGLLGPNGCGKSTLIRALLGELAGGVEIDEGEVLRSDKLQVAYFDQVRDSLDPEKTVARTVCPVGEFVDYAGRRMHYRSYLDRFLFSPSQVEMRVGALSGGEQSRVLLALLMLKPANVLVLDEPTNDLDLATLSVLEECLDEFEGAVILVSHDRYFLDQVCDRLLAPESDGSGRWNFYEGLSQWEASRKKAKSSERQALQPGVQAETRAQPEAPRKRKLSYKDQRELDGMEAAIHAAEARLAELTRESEKPENLSNAVLLARLTQELSDAQAEVDRLYSRWSELL
jgi:ATP-binding cassette subfamily F protein uup